MAEGMPNDDASMDEAYHIEEPLDAGIFGFSSDVETADESQWLFVQAEGEEIVVEERLTSDSEDDGWEAWVRHRTNASTARLPETSESSIVQIPMKSAEVQAEPSAILLSDGAFVHCHSCVMLCDGGADITASWADALEGFPAVCSIYSLGRIAINPEARYAGTLALPVVARIAVLNNGKCAWPEATALRIVAGDPFGFDALACGGVLPGCGAEFTLDLSVPACGDRGTGVRSAWVLTDDHGRPFGPLLVVEVVWA